MHVPPGSQESTDPVPAGHNPWSPPPAGPAAAPWPLPPYPLPPQQPRNALGIASLVLGVAGVLLGLAIILFWISWLPALLAVILGLVAMSRVRQGRATNRAMAVAGVILGGVGLLIAVGGGAFAITKVRDIAHDVREQAEQDQADADAAEKARHMAFGQSYTFRDGLKVTVATPQPFVPSEAVFGHAKGNKAFEITITVVNTGTQRVAVESMPYVDDATGAPAQWMVDGSGRQKVVSDYVLPGQQVVGKYGFSLPPEAADRMKVRFSPIIKRFPFADWSGPTGS
ncbi:DUF4190 domain-containing protein [Streptomyces sp. NPDC006733]|uniref:DUF4190 domain-containing protein n=1 Tax=Streptomyces sp. NPDC006733 TaxID=3155460 RepID=UPI00340CB4D5